MSYILLRELISFIIFATLVTFLIHALLSDNPKTPSDRLQNEKNNLIFLY